MNICTQYFCGSWLTFWQMGQSSRWSPWRPDGHSVWSQPAGSPSLCYSTVTPGCVHAGGNKNTNSLQTHPDLSRLEDCKCPTTIPSFFKNNLPKVIKRNIRNLFDTFTFRPLCMPGGFKLNLVITCLIGVWLKGTTLFLL